MTPYATLAYTKAELKAGTTADDAKLYNNIRETSARLDRIFQSRHPVFAPYIESRSIPVNALAVNSNENTLFFPDNLLELTAVTAGATPLTINTTVEAWPPLTTIIHRLRLMSLFTSWYTYCETNRKPLQVQITGVWGFHRDYANAWIAVDTLAGNINDTATSFTVSDIDGVDDLGRTPRLSAGNLVKIDSEYVEIVATNTGTNVATCKRGVNGSTAAAHSTSAPVYVWQVEEAVQRLVSRQSAFIYARRGAYESANISDAGILNFPSDLLGEVRGLLQGYAYGEW